MVFIITKVLLWLILPPASILLLLTAGALAIQSHRCLGRLPLAAGVLLLYLFSVQPVSEALLQPLEKAFPPFTNKAVDADAIVVLGGGVRDLSWAGLRPEPSGASLARTIAGISLYKTFHLPLLITGGSGDPARPDLKEAEAMARTAVDLGVPRKNLIIDNSARNTVESARMVRGLIAGKRIILVTSAFHMKRAYAMFKKQGLDVIAAPTAYLCGPGRLSPYSFIPRTDDLSLSTTALSEYLSLAWYALTGAI